MIRIQSITYWVGYGVTENWQMPVNKDLDTRSLG